MRKLWETTAALSTPAMVVNDFNISASQMKTWFMCPRKWWFFRVAKIIEPQKHHFVVGHAIHSVAERYLSRQASTWEELFPTGWDKGLEPDESVWIRILAEEAVAKGIWKSKPGITIEHPVAYLTGREFLNERGLPLIAEADTFIDAKGIRRIAKLKRLIDGRSLPSGWDRLPPFVGFIDHLDLPDAEIVDHKSAKSKRYVLSPAKLAKDVQVLSYAATPLVLRPELQQVHVRHNILLKEESAADPVYTVEADVGLQDVQASWAATLQAAEDMATARSMAPITIVPDRPEERARNFHMVRSAIDMGCTRDACEAYGGCPFRDACFGRATIAQVVRRLDAPDISGLVRSKGVLAQNSPPPLSPRTGLISRYLQEQHMAFAKPQPTGPKFQPHQQVYTRDPEQAQVQYLCMILNPGFPGGADPIIAVYPDAEVEPDLNSLPKEFEVQVPESALQSIPFVGAAIVGYAQTLTAAGGVVPPWRPASNPRHAVKGQAPAALAPASVVNVNAQPPVVGAIETTDKPVKRPERDGKFGGLLPAAPAVPAPGVAQGVLQPGVGAALAAQATRVQADLAAIAPPAATAYIPQVGDVVVVKPTDAPYWKSHVGKRVTVAEISEGLNGFDISFMLDGFEQPPVAVSRFDFVSRPSQAGAPSASPAPTAASITFEDASKLKGQLVSVVMRGSTNPNNGALEEVYQTDSGPALAMFNGKMRVFLADVESCKLLGIGDVPGAKKAKPKLSPEEKAAAKIEKEAAKAAAKAATAPIPGQQDLSSITNQAPPPMAVPVYSDVVAQPGALQQPPVFVGAPQVVPPLFTPGEQAVIAARESGKMHGPIMAQIAQIRFELGKLEAMMLGG